jgi:hypothetical protein
MRLVFATVIFHILCIITFTIIFYYEYIIIVSFKPSRITVPLRVPEAFLAVAHKLLFLLFAKFLFLLRFS